MKTLQNLTDALKAAGCIKPKMERSYKRRDHRETLVSAWLRTGGKSSQKERKEQAAGVFAALRSEGFELTSDYWDYAAGEATHIWVQAKVALPDPL